MFNALLIASNGTDSRVGSLTADWEVLAHGHLLHGPSRTGIQRIEREDEPRRVSLEVMLRGTCDRSRLLDLVELPEKEQFHPNGTFHHPVKHGKRLK